MSFWYEVDEAIEKVRQGKEAVCPLCKKGLMSISILLDILFMGRHNTLLYIFYNKIHYN